jgi:hypothetical protein
MAWRRNRKFPAKSLLRRRICVFWAEFEDSERDRRKLPVFFPAPRENNLPGAAALPPPIARPAGGHTSPAVIPVKPGKYHVRLQLDGFQPAERDMTVTDHKAGIAESQIETGAIRSVIRRQEVEAASS